MKKLYKNFVFDLTIALSALVLGIVMLPPFGIGIYALNILLAATLVVYFLVYLLDKLKRTRGSIFLLTFLECIVYFFIVLDLIFQQFRVFEALSVCRALGLVFFVRGFSSALGMYINATSEKCHKPNLPRFISRIIFIAFGVYMFANPLINDNILNWGMCILFFVSTLAFGALALLFAPQRKKKNGK